MQVNPSMSLSPSVLKGPTVGEQTAEQVDNTSKTPVDAAKQMEIVAKTLAKLENAVLQWFIEQRPELGTTLAQLLTLQEQLSNQNTVRTTNSTDNVNEKLLKILDMMKMLLISPKAELAAKSSATASSQTIFALLGELEKLKKEQSPAVQAKIDTFIAKLTNLFKDTNRAANLFDTQQNVQQQMSGTLKNTERTAENITNKHTATNDGEAELNLLKAEINNSGNGKGSSSVPNAQRQQSNTIINENDEGTKSTRKPDGEMTRSNQGQVLEKSGAVTEEDGCNTPTPVNRNAPELVLGQSIHKATIIQQKLQEILLQFADELNQHEPSNKVCKVLQDIAECVKSLQITPETEWENLLRYPVIYKQTLHKAVKLLQELININNSDKPHQNTVALLTEVIANLHVQTSFNQLRQESPANQTMYFQIPLQIGNEIKNGEMLVVYQREKQGTKWETVNSWYRFYLETQYIGPVQINLHAANKQLNIQFLLADENQAGLFDEKKMDLKQVLIHYGYDVVDISCGVGAVTPLFQLDVDSVKRQCIDIMI